MSYLSDRQLDDTIAHALHYDTVVTPAQKQRAWQALREKVEASLGDTNEPAADPCLAAADVLPSRNVFDVFVVSLLNTLDQSAQFLLADEFSLERARQAVNPVSHISVMWNIGYTCA